MKALKNKNGFTLIELIITMVLIGIVAFVVADAMSTGIRAFFVTDNRKEALDQARIAMERMTREIRNVRSISDISGTISGTQFCFTDLNATTISFRYAGTTLTREVLAAGLGDCPGLGGNTLASSITSFSFSYLQTNGSLDPAPPSANTKRIRITLTSTISGENVQLQSEVWLRNL